MLDPGTTSWLYSVRVLWNLGVRIVFWRLTPICSFSDGGLSSGSGLAGQVEVAACGHLLAGQCLIALAPVMTLLSPLLRDMVDLGLVSSDPIEATACYRVNVVLL